MTHRRMPRHGEHRVWDRRSSSWTIGLPDLPEAQQETLAVLTLDDLAACYDQNQIGWTYEVMKEAARMTSHGVPLTVELVAYLECMAIRAAGRLEQAAVSDRSRREEVQERKRTLSWVYFLRHDDKVKIGVSMDPVARALQLSHRPSDIVGVVQGNERLERSLHARFASDRDGNTEWFTWTTQIADYVAQYADAFTPQHQAYCKPSPAPSPRKSRSGYDGLLRAITGVDA